MAKKLELKTWIADVCKDYVKLINLRSEKDRHKTASNCCLALMRSQGMELTPHNIDDMLDHLKAEGAKFDHQKASAHAHHTAQMIR